MSESQKSSAISLAVLQSLEKNTQKATTTSPTPQTETPSSKNSKLKSTALGPLKTKISSLEQFERSVGGRDSLIDSLGLATLDKKQQHLLDLLCDPRRAKDSINSIARDAGLSPNQILDLFRSATFSKAHAVAMGRMAEALPGVVDDIASKSVDAKVECPTCFGSKEVGKDLPCPQCYGKGEVMRFSDLDRQKIVLESTGITKKGAGVNVNVQTNVGVINPGSFFSKYVKDSDRAAYDISNEVIDVEPETK